MLYSAIFTVLVAVAFTAQCAQVSNFMQFEDGMVSAQVQPLLAVLRLLAATTPTLNDDVRLKSTSPIAKQVWSAVGALQRNEVGPFLEFTKGLYESVNVEPGTNPVITLYTKLSQELQSQLSAPRLLTDKKNAIDMLDSMNSDWSFIGEPCEDRLVINCRQSRELRRYIPINSRRYRLSHTVCRVSGRISRESYAMCKYDLDFDKVIAQLAQSQRTESIAEDDGPGLVPKEYCPLILVYVRDTSSPVVPLDLIPCSLPKVLYHESLRLPLHILAFIFDDINTLDSNEDLVVALKQMRSKESVEQGLLDSIGRAFSEYGSFIDLMRMLPRDYVASRVSQLQIVEEPECGLCTAKGTIVIRNSPVVDVSPPVECLSTALTDKVTSTKMSRAMANCPKCKNNSNHKIFTTTTCEFSRFLLINTDANPWQMDIPLVDLKVGGKKFERLLAVIDKGDNAWLWMKDDYWLIINKDGMEIVSIDEGKLPFYTPQILVYRR